MTNVIWGLGTAVPAESMTQEEALQMTTELVCQDERQARYLKVLFRGAGVEHRNISLPWKLGYRWKRELGGVEGRGPSTTERMRLYHEHAPPLATASSSNALQDADISASETTHLVTVSCTGFSAPGVERSLIESLKLRPTVQRINVGYMGCHGAINGLRVAQALADADPHAVVLLTAVELCCLHYCLHWDPDALKGNALFADGAASLVIGGRPASARSGRGWTIRATGSCLLPESSDEMSWLIGDHGFEMRLTSQVPVMIEKHLKPWMAHWLESLGLGFDQIAAWGIHPGGPKILTAAETALGLPPKSCTISREILREQGNMSSPTVLFILDRLRQETEGPIVLLGFGPGLTAEAAVLEPAG